MKKRIRKQLLAIMICLVITVTGFAGCAGAGREGLSATENITAAGTASDEEQSAEQTLSSESDEAESSEEVLEEAPKKKIENYRNNEEGHYEFNPHVFSKRYLEYHGEDVMKSFFNMVDALRAGEDTFECSSEYAYGWCTGGRLINFFFPVATDCIEPMQGTGTDAYKNGIGKINYTIPKEEFLQREKEFEEQVVGILNTCIADDYDDFEKCLAIYEYVTMNYRYDYYVYDNLNELPFDFTSTYRCFKEKHGICCEIAGMYNYLLLQCGVDSEECGGDHRELESHAWVFVTIDGQSYHIDPTWGLTSRYAPLSYFMMTDEIRDQRDNFPVEKFDIAGGGDESRELFEFWAKDDKYSELWDGYYLGMDRERKMLIYYVDNMDERREFYYGGEG